MKPPCPYLPVPERPMRPGDLRVFGKARDAGFYLAALQYAQTHWLAGSPGQTLLKINRALGCELAAGDAAVQAWPLPYRAAVWVMQNRGDGEFVGNPRRHFQHLATRMVEPRKELRTWRAWACWRLGKEIFPDHPADEDQIAAEHIREPSDPEIGAMLDKLGLPGEREVWQAALAMAMAGPKQFGAPVYAG